MRNLYFVEKPGFFNEKGETREFAPGDTNSLSGRYSFFYKNASVFPEKCHSDVHAARMD